MVNRCDDWSQDGIRPSGPAIGVAIGIVGQRHTVTRALESVELSLKP